MENLKGCEGREAPGRCHKQIQGSRSHSALRQGGAWRAGPKRREQGRGAAGADRRSFLAGILYGEREGKEVKVLSILIKSARKQMNKE